MQDSDDSRRARPARRHDEHRLQHQAHSPPTLATTHDIVQINLFIEDGVYVARGSVLPMAIFLGGSAYDSAALGDPRTALYKSGCGGVLRTLYHLVEQPIVVSLAA